MKYGFISAGGGSWYTNTLKLLEPGKRIWVNIPGKGYVGVGEVTGQVVKAVDFTVTQPDGTEVPLPKVGVTAPDMFQNADDDQRAEYMVPVKWIKTVPLKDAIKETGFFGNQNTVCKPRDRKWLHTVERLKVRFGIR